MAFANVLYELKQTGARIQELLDVLDVLDFSVNSDGELELTPDQIAYVKEALEIGDTGAVIDDDGVSTDKTWSSEKIDEEMKAIMKYTPVKLTSVTTVPAVLDKLTNDVVDLAVKTTAEFSKQPVDLTVTTPGGDFFMGDITPNNTFILSGSCGTIGNANSFDITVKIDDGVTEDTVPVKIPCGYKRRIGVAAMPGNGVVTTSWVQNLPSTSSAIYGKGPSFTVNAGSGQYVWFCVYKESPGAVDFKFKDVNSGFVGGFHRHENVSSDCPYIVYVSDNPGLGPVTIQPQ